MPQISIKITKILLSLFGIIFIISSFSVSAAEEQPALSIKQKAEINQMIRDYILDHPEILPEAIQILQNRTKTAMLKRHHTRLYNDGFSYVGGNKNGDVTIIEFFDYNCGYCKTALDTMEKLIKADKNLRVIYKEFPILSESSYVMSKAAMASMKQGKYPEFHAALMKSTGKMTENRIFKIARDLGIDEQILAKDMTSPVLERNIQINHGLAKALQITGTPGFIIGDTVIPGAVPYEELVKAIERTRRASQKAK